MFSSTPKTGLEPLQARADLEKLSFRYVLSAGDIAVANALTEFLKSQAFEVGDAGGSPAFRTKEAYTTALNRIWNLKPEGWTELKKEFVENKICTAQEFDNASQKQ